jgi:alkyl sulfatase BDS1-like metallo-beta-lactamase superfamily hydrolase
MNKRNFISLMALISTLILFSSCMNFGKPRTVVREPAAPGESRLEYQVPAPGRLNLSVGEALLSWRGMAGKVDKVCEGVYLARGFAIANVAMVVTKEGLVVIDTTESVDAAKEILEKFRKISSQPVRYIIYTHGHGDHTQGSSVFYSKGVDVIAAKNFAQFVNFETGLIGPYLRTARNTQAGRIAPEFMRSNIPFFKSSLRAGVGTSEMAMPNITFEGHYQFELGGEQFELFQAPGETPDQIYVWMPKKRVLFCGDNYYMSFPNLSSPMLAPRSVPDWIASLEKAIALKPEYLVPGHSEQVVGEKAVIETLTNYHDGVKSVFDQTIACINQGKTVEEAVQVVKLPENLTQYRYLHPYYGRVDWSVRGIYQGSVGWYDGNGAHLIPDPPSYRARELVKLAGGADKVLARAIELQKSNEHQLAVELCEVVIQANPDDKTAHLIEAVSLEQMAMDADGINRFGFYLSSSEKEFQAAGYKP